MLPISLLPEEIKKLVLTHILPGSLDKHQHHQSLSTRMLPLAAFHTTGTHKPAVKNPIPLFSFSDAQTSKELLTKGEKETPRTKNSS